MPDFPQILRHDRKAGTAILVSRGERETESLGCLLARHLEPGDVVSLDGDLGAGKTVLTRGIAAGLGCRGAVSSPTFILLVEHPAVPGKCALYHFDAYRLGGAGEFAEAGLHEYFESDGVCVVEWGSRIAGILPARTLAAVMCRTLPDRADERLIDLSWPDQPEKLDAILKELARATACPDETDGGAAPC